MDRWGIDGKVLSSLLANLSLIPTIMKVMIPALLSFVTWLAFVVFASYQPVLFCTTFTIHFSILYQAPTHMVSITNMIAEILALIAFGYESKASNNAISGFRSERNLNHDHISFLQSKACPIKLKGNPHNDFNDVCVYHVAKPAPGHITTLSPACAKQFKDYCTDMKNVVSPHGVMFVLNSPLRKILQPDNKDMDHLIYQGHVCEHIKNTYSILRIFDFEPHELVYMFFVLSYDRSIC